MFTNIDEEKELVLSKKVKSQSSEKSTLKSTGRELLRKEAAAEIIKSIGGFPKKGESFDVITNGESNTGSFYEVFRDANTIDVIYIATWIINRYYIDMLVSDLESGRIKEVNLIISNRMAQLGSHKGNFNILKSLGLTTKNFNLRVANSHAKTYTMKSGDKYITVDGSGNWSKNPRIENYTITNCKGKFEFRQKWMSELINM